MFVIWKIICAICRIAKKQGWRNNFFMGKINILQPEFFGASPHFRARTKGICGFTGSNPLSDVPEILQLVSYVQFNFKVKTVPERVVLRPT